MSLPPMGLRRLRSPWWRSFRRKNIRRCLLITSPILRRGSGSLRARCAKRHLALVNEQVKSRVLRVGAFDGEELVGLSYGRHAGDSTFNMSISMVRPAYRRRGIYGELLRYVLARTKQDGFLKVISRHRATNNAVIIPKLRAAS